MGESTDGPASHQPATEASADADAGRPGGHRRTRLLLGFLTLAAVAAMVPLAALAHRDLLTNAGSGLVLLAPFAVVGALVARRLPGNPIGWLSLAFALCFLLSNDAGFYLIANYRLGRQLPLSPVMLFVQPLWEVSLLSLPLVVLLFPDGRLPSLRWRTVQWSYIALCALFGIAACARAAYAIGAHRIQVDSSGDLTTVIQGAGWANDASAPGFVLLVMFSLSFAGRQALSWRRSSGERREQLKWLVSGAAVSVVSVVLSVQIGSASGFRHVVANLLAFGLAATPLGIGMGILKYRLYDIDRIISRTLAYAMVTGLLVGVYAGLVLLATHVLSVSSPVAVAASTLAAAALFNPLRRRVQRAVDRRFNRSRYDADEMVTAFAARLKDAVDLDTVRDDLAQVVNRALEPTHVAVRVVRSD
jgi:hypothetical protein